MPSDPGTVRDQLADLDDEDTAIRSELLDLDRRRAVLNRALAAHARARAFLLKREDASDERTA